MSNRDLMENSMGVNGAEFISDTVIHTAVDSYVSLQVVSDMVISAIVGSFTGNTLVGVLLPQGTVLYGKFKSITLTSGQVIAYKGI